MRRHFILHRFLVGPSLPFLPIVSGHFWKIGREASTFNMAPFFTRPFLHIALFYTLNVMILHDGSHVATIPTYLPPVPLHKTSSVKMGRLLTLQFHNDTVANHQYGAPRPTNYIASIIHITSHIQFTSRLQINITNNIITSII